MKEKTFSKRDVVDVEEVGVRGIEYVLSFAQSS